LDQLRPANFANDLWPPEPEAGQTISIIFAGARASARFNDHFGAMLKMSGRWRFVSRSGVNAARRRRNARGGAKLFHFFDDEHFDWLAAGQKFVVRGQWHGLGSIKMIAQLQF